MISASNLLYIKKIKTSYQQSSLPEEALDVFYGSEMQKILS
jgi:hypothetical protein